MISIKFWLVRFAYNFIILPLGTGAAATACLFHKKIRKSLLARFGLAGRWKMQAAEVKKGGVWFHVCSVGEFEQALPVIDNLKEAHPGVPIALTFFSPSGYEYAFSKTGAKPAAIDFVEYLPLDFPWNARFCIACLKPKLLIFTKFDLWPNLIWHAFKLNIPSILIDATLSSSSWRLTAPGRFFYSELYGNLSRILAISDKDADRFRDCCPGQIHIETTGDTRFDRVVQRKKNRIDIPGLLRQKRVFIAGSTWPPDEERLLPAAARLLREHPELIMLIAPHEPSPARMIGLRSWATREGFDAEALSMIEEGSSQRVVIVDSVGKLAELYCCGEAAYVGGSFSSGVHNVIEPAIMEIPVLFGPVYRNSFEAAELLKKGGAFLIETADDIFNILTRLLEDEEKRKHAGSIAGELVNSMQGAAFRCSKVISELITD